MNKIFNVLFSVFFVLFVFVFALLLIFLPKKDFSENENRTLEGFPALSAKSFFSGDFMKDLDTFYADQFPFRDEWIRLNTEYNKLLLKKDINGVYLGKDNFLLEVFDNIDQDLTQRQVQALKSFCEAQKDNTNLYFCIIPNSVYILSEKLPAYAHSTDQKEYIDGFYSAVSDKVKTINVIDNLLSHKDEYIYYRTDHHWTSLGAYYGYETIAKEMGLTVTPLSSFENKVVTESFLGTYYSKGLFPVPPDSMSAYSVLDPEFSLTLESSNVGTINSLNDESKLEIKDKYSYFLGGNTDICKITTSSPSGKTLFIIKDSYSHCLAQFFVENYTYIYLFDLRYLKSKTVSDYISELNPDDVLIIYNASTLSSDLDFRRIEMGTVGSK